MGKGWASISCDRHGVRLEMWRSPMIWAQRTPEALSEPLRKIWLPCMEEGKQPSQIPGTPCEVCERGTSPHTDMTLWRSFRVCKDAMREKAFCTNAVWERGVSTLEKINSIPAKKKKQPNKKTLYHKKHNTLSSIPEQKLWWGDQRHLELFDGLGSTNAKCSPGYQQHPSGKGPANMQVANKGKRQTVSLWCITLSPGLKAIFKGSALC